LGNGQGGKGFSADFQFALYAIKAFP